VAEGWGLGTRELQHASRDSISERWGERTHSKTLAQPRLHPSALAAAGLLLSTLGSRVGNTTLTFHTSESQQSQRLTSRKSTATAHPDTTCHSRLSAAFAAAQPDVSSSNRSGKSRLDLSSLTLAKPHVLKAHETFKGLVLIAGARACQCHQRLHLPLGISFTLLYLLFVCLYRLLTRTSGPRYPPQRVAPPDPRVEGRDSRLFFVFRGSRGDFFEEFTARGGSGVQEGDGVWPRAGVLGHASYSTPLVIPYQSAGARERTPRPKPNRACTPPLSPLPGSFSRPLGRELGTRH